MVVLISKWGRVLRFELGFRIYAAVGFQKGFRISMGGLQDLVGFWISAQLLDFDWRALSNFVSEQRFPPG